MFNMSRHQVRLNVRVNVLKVTCPSSWKNTAAFSNFSVRISSQILNFCRSPFCFILPHTVHIFSEAGISVDWSRRKWPVLQPNKAKVLDYWLTRKTRKIIICCWPGGAFVCVSLRCHVCENDKAVRSIQRMPVYSDATHFVEKIMIFRWLSQPWLNRQRKQTWHYKVGWVTDKDHGNAVADGL